MSPSSGRVPRSGSFSGQIHLVLAEAVFLSKRTRLWAQSLTRNCRANIPPPIGIGLLREDTGLGRVWYKGLRTQYHPTADTTERLAFDFSLQAGDSFDISNHVVGMASGSYPPSWSLVDSMKTIPGRKHIYFRGACDWVGPPPYEPLTFIEGIGCNVGPMFKHKGPTLLQSQYLLCSYKDSARTFYSNIRYNGDCFLPTSVDTSPASNGSVAVFPNPASVSLSVTYRVGDRLLSLVLFNELGQRMVQSGTNELQVCGLPSGVHLLQINFEDQPPVYRRVVLQ